MIDAGAPGRSASLQPLLATREIAVVCGSGGVGKTSVAAAAALGAATHLGGKVLVLTIDPARRLANALGLEGFGNVEKQVPTEALKQAGLEPRGELWAAMLDTKRSWDELVLRHAPDEESAYRILENRLYQNVTARFVQSHDYIAMERLYDIHATGVYDLIVVDTPPTRNALDFLDAPARMAEFFGGRLLRWLTMPYRVGGKRGARVFNVASRPFYQLADRILGSQFLQDIADFFLSFQSMQPGFIARANEVERLLHDRRTTFAVVTTLESAPLREAEIFCDQLTARQFQLGAMVLNRALPDYLRSEDGNLAAGRLIADAAPVAASLARTDPSLADPARTARVLRTIGESYRNFAVVATREAELRTELARAPEIVATVPNFEVDIHDVSGLAAIAERLFPVIATPAELALRKTELRGEPLEHVERLAASWSLLADLCFSDLLLLAPVAGEAGRRFVVLAQVRPTTGQTVYPADMVGVVVEENERPLVSEAFRTAEIVDGEATALGSSERSRVQCIPVRHRGEVVAVVRRDLNPASGRRAGHLERLYLEVFERLARMVAAGSFPFVGDETEVEEAPRVGDGAILLDRQRRIRFASPNAVSALHRMGIHAYADGMRLREIGFDEVGVAAAFDGRVPVTEELERGDTSVLLRAIPLLEQGEPVGALVLVRDVSDLRRRDRMLVSKDATIREIHHRVKNNLQTIASLLRLQRRRLESTEAALAVAESEQRIRSIGIVHEILAREPGEMVPFIEVVKSLVRMVEETFVSPETRLRFEVAGDPGEIPGAVATPLAVVLNELVQNAVDHAFPLRSDAAVEGTVCVTFDRDGGQLVVDVVDDGIGLPAGFSLEQSRGLGLTIVDALVTSELGGSLKLEDANGTRARLSVPLERIAARDL